MKAALRAIFHRVTAPVVRLHRDDRGDTLEYVLVLGAFAIPMMGLFYILRKILSDYYSMIAFYVGWPFL